MKAKTKLIATLMAICLVVTLGVFGILAVKTLNMSVGGNITFSAEGIAMKLSNGEFKTTGGSEYTGITAQSGKLQGFEMNTNTKLSDVQDKINSWTGLELVATESLGDAVLHFTITNLMQNETLAVVTTTSLGTNLNENMNIVVSPSTANIAYGTPQSFTIKFEVLDKSINAKLTGFTVAMQMYAGTVSEGATDTNLVYTESASVANTYTVKAATTATGEVKIPQFVKQETGVYPVTEIEAEAFKGNTAITSITIPESVTSIGTKAFYGCTALKTVVNNTTITSIPSYAFYGCKQLTEVPFTDSITSIGMYAFYNCTALTNVVIPDRVTTIDIYAFAGCSSMTSFVLGQGVTVVPNYLLNNCSKLIALTLNPNVRSIGTASFANTKLTSFCLPKNTTTISTNFLSGCTTLTSLTVEEGNSKYKSANTNGIIETSSKTLVLGCKNTIMTSDITQIGANAFAGCTGLTQLPSLENITSIGNSAFSKCKGLTSVTIPSNVKTIGTYVFNECTKITTATIQAGGITLVPDYMFYKCSKLATVNLPESGMTAIGEAAFYNCSAITSFTIPEGVTTIGSYCFYETKIKSIVFPDSVTTIEGSVFYSTESLESVTFGKNLQTIGSWAFRFTSLATVHLPASLKSLGSNSFNYNSLSSAKITVVYMDCNVPSGAESSILFNHTEYVYIKENIVVTDSAFTEVESDVAGYKKYTETLKGTTSSNY